MAIGWFAVFLSSGILEMIIERHHPVERRYQQIGTQNTYKGED